MTLTFRFSLIVLLLLVLAPVTTSAKRIGNSSSHIHPNTTEEFETCEFSNLAHAITWAPVEVECPVCKTKNNFLEPMSYGNYIYDFPSKYQLVFWPHTDSASWYSCKKCRYTAYMGVFKNVPPEKIAELRTLLEGVYLPPQKTISGEEGRHRPPYTEISVAERIAVAEKVYRVLGNPDDAFWNHFYRVKAYHLENDKKLAEADEARKKSLALSERMLADKEKAGSRKEVLYLIGAMKYFLRDRVGALKSFEAASKLTLADKELDEEQNKNYDEYLSSLIKEYIEMLEKGEGPKMDGL